MKRKIPCALLLSLMLAPAMAAQAADYVTLTGKELYQRFCASCHGVEGRGDGPVAATLSVQVPDLTLVARHSGNAFPRDRVVRIIDGRYTIGAHGSRTMPVWGEELGRAEVGNPDAERATRIVIDRLADYVWLLQRPATPTTSATH